MPTFDRHYMNAQATLPIAALFGQANPGDDRKDAAGATAGRTGQSSGTTVADSTPFTPNDLPDLVATTHDAGVQWQGAAWRASYRSNSSMQDNRQTVRSNADQFRDDAHDQPRANIITASRSMSGDGLGASAADRQHAGRGAAHGAAAAMLATFRQLASDDRTTSAQLLATAGAGTISMTVRARRQSRQRRASRFRDDAELPFARGLSGSSAQVFLRYACQSPIALSPAQDPVELAGGAAVERNADAEAWSHDSSSPCGDDTRTLITIDGDMTLAFAEQIRVSPAQVHVSTQDATR